MPSTYTSSLRLVLPATGELTNTWGTVFNAGATSLIDNAIAGTASITMTAANYTLSNNNGSADESRSMFLVLGGTPGGSYNVICPAVSKLYFVTNNTGHAQTVKTAAGTGISVPNGARMTLRCDGTNVVEALTYFGSLTLGSLTLNSPLGVASGGTGAATFTANNVLLGNGTSAFQVVAPGTAGNVLTSNGTTWTSAAVAASVSSINFGTTGLTPSTATSGAVTVAGTLAVANGGTGVTTSTGSGSVVLSTSPALTTPNLGTPSAATLTNATGLPLSTGVTGTLPVANGGTGGTTFAANNVLLGNGTGSFQVVAPGTNGNVLTSNGTTWTSTALPAGGLVYVFTTTPITLTDKQGALTDTSGGAFTVTLPATPSTGAQVVVADAGNAWGTNNLTVGRNGSTIGGLAQDLVCDITGASVQLVYDGTTWEVYAQIGGNGGNVVTLDGTQTLTNKTIAFGSNTLSGTKAQFDTALTDDNFAYLATAQTFTATQTLSGSSSVLATALTNAAEVANVSATAATGTINYDITTQSVLYYTTNASANWTVNFRASSGTSLNTALATGQSVTVAFLVTQGSTAYYNNVVQVDGASVTPKWQGGTAPTAGNASSIDSYVYTIIKTGAATFTVLASQTRFA